MERTAHGYDHNVRVAFNAITGLFPNEDQWGEATRGFGCAGLGLRTTQRHATPAYVASRIQTHDMCQELDEDYQWEGANQASALAQCIAALNHELGVHQRVAIDAPTPIRQHDLSHHISHRHH